MTAVPTLAISHTTTPTSNPLCFLHAHAPTYTLAHSHTHSHKNTQKHTYTHTLSLRVPCLRLNPCQCTVTGVFYDDDNEFLIEENTKQAAGAEARDGASTIGVVVAKSYALRCRSRECWAIGWHQCHCYLLGRTVMNVELQTTPTKGHNQCFPLHITHCRVCLLGSSWLLS